MNFDKPRVSFVMPAYKRSFLREAIASILAQTYRDLELIVVDDCSPEDLKSIVDEFCDERLAYHRNPANMGGKDLVSSWNHAMKYARYEWCVLASDDDIYDRNYLASMVAIIKKYPNCNLVHSRVATINANGVITGISAERVEIESATQFIYMRVLKGDMLTAQEYMFRTAALREIGGFVDFPRAWFSDEATWFALSRNGVGCSSEVLFYWRISGENISSLKSDIREKMIATLLYSAWAKKNIHHILCSAKKEDEFKANMIAQNLKYRNEGIVRSLARQAPMTRRIIMVFCRSIATRIRIRILYDMLIPYSK